VCCVRTAPTGAYCDDAVSSCYEAILVEVDLDPIARTEHRS
jgi:hypothetical protein